MTFEEKYDILGAKDESFNGIFFTAVKTTGIFCHPSCRARKPLSKNVVFYDSIDECLDNGFRPCKICKPADVLGKIPPHIQNLITELQSNPELRITDDILKSKNIEPSSIRRWFKSNYDMTFHTFQRMLRINYAFNNIKKGHSITDSAFESGFESLSGFNDSYRTVMGASVGQTKDKNIVTVARISSPIGSMIGCATEDGLCYLGFIGQKRLEEQLIEIKKYHNAVILPGNNIHLEQVQEELDNYFKGEMDCFSVSLDLVGTEFRKEVWHALTNIPYGNTVSYKEQALAINNVKAVRAVASANGANKISIIIPCHRVIGSNGKLTGYAGGIHRKKWLLNFEMKNANIPFQKELDLE